jgi:hypothetical protein
MPYDTSMAVVSKTLYMQRTVFAYCGLAESQKLDLHRNLMRRTETAVTLSPH